MDSVVQKENMYWKIQKLANPHFVSVFHSVNKGMTNSYFKNISYNLCFILNIMHIFISLI